MKSDAMIESKLRLVEYTIPDNPKSKLQKYGLTDLGVRYLEEK